MHLYIFPRAVHRVYPSPPPHTRTAIKMIAWLPHVSLHIHFSCCFLLTLVLLLACFVMPSSSGLSSHLAPKGQLIMKPSTAVLLLSIVLLASSCEARGLPAAAHGKVRSSNKSHRLPGKNVAAATSLRADGWLTRQMKARHMGDQQEQADAKEKEGMKMAAPSAGAVRATPTTTPAVIKVSQRLSRREDTGFHLDYAGPRTHTPSHN